MMDTANSDQHTSCYQVKDDGLRHLRHSALLPFRIGRRTEGWLQVALHLKHTFHSARKSPVSFIKWLMKCIMYPRNLLKSKRTLHGSGMTLLMENTLVCSVIGLQSLHNSSTRRNCH